jgi:hypothetical protein
LIVIPATVQGWFFLIRHSGESRNPALRRSGATPRKVRPPARFECALPARLTGRAIAKKSVSD